MHRIWTEKRLHFFFQRLCQAHLLYFQSYVIIRVISAFLSRVTTVCVISISFNKSCCKTKNIYSILQVDKSVYTNKKKSPQTQRVKGDFAVPRIGVEPTRLAALAPETSASTIPPPGPMHELFANAVQR